MHSHVVLELPDEILEEALLAFSVEEHLEELGLLQTLFVGVGGVSYLLGDELLFLMVVADVLRKGRLLDGVNVHFVLKGVPQALSFLVELLQAFELHHLGLAEEEQSGVLENEVRAQAVL